MRIPPLPPLKCAPASTLEDGGDLRGSSFSAPLLSAVLALTLMSMGVPIWSNTPTMPIEGYKLSLKRSLYFLLQD